ncbi:uroporphyrinogen-III C-methyltransferase [Desertivirga xinjiangensis]|uniref:uroporphyrinogen-III C-methyltransferase n=1 Tax=Desertivirga xinjiangensis TaxID=539206 RepID=UPI002108FDA0|nr:uroporphyrinogen-III C-methyltransferase [Pedobacter xinjiangensis]
MQENTIKPQLYVIGAGPGDPELITLKAFKVLQKTKVILYDNLANKELLDLAPEDCELIYVGKHPYGEYTPQERIHELIKEKSFEKGLIVRLKGGDPFIFGRGYEEMIFARENGIEAFFIPGITSMQASGFEDIPLTHRTLSEGIWVVTGTKKDGTLSNDLRLAMQSNSTVVIYMGMKKLQDIADTYIKEGMGETPAAIIQHATLAKQKSAVGTAKNLPKMAIDNKLTHPAIVIIGEVVGLKIKG